MQKRKKISQIKRKRGRPRKNYIELNSTTAKIMKELYYHQNNLSEAQIARKYGKSREWERQIKEKMKKQKIESLKEEFPKLTTKQEQQKQEAQKWLSQLLNRFSNRKGYDRDTKKDLNAFLQEKLHSIIKTFNPEKATLYDWVR